MSNVFPFDNHRNNMDMTTEVDAREARNRDWEEKWEQNCCPWHKYMPHPYLQKFISNLTQEQTDLKVLVPMCGKAIDLHRLAEEGHHVSGVELSHKAIED